MSKTVRQPHAVLDLPSRQLKGMKFAHLLDLAARRSLLRMLEIGTGSRGIAHYFGTHPGPRCEVTAVDVVDQLPVHHSYRFQLVLVHDITLPFSDSSVESRAIPVPVNMRPSCPADIAR